MESDVMTDPQARPDAFLPTPWSAQQMTGCRILACVLALLMIAFPGGSARAAEPVSYAIKFVASGDVDGVPFTDELQVFAGVTDTDTAAAISEASPAQLAQIIFALNYVVGLPFVI